MDPLAATRAIHFATTMLVAGAAVFSILVAEPIWHPAHHARLDPYRSKIARVVSLSLALAVGSGAVHLVLVAADIVSEPWPRVVGDGMVWTVLSDTQFGFVSQLRLLLAVVLAGLLILSMRRDNGAPGCLRVLAALVACLFLGSLAWTGHAAGASGASASAHFISDAVHILAAGIWVGGLFPLALLMRWASQSGDHRYLDPYAQVLRRFSNRAVVSVAALLASGLINTCFPTDHMRGVTDPALDGAAHGRQSVHCLAQAGSTSAHCVSRNRHAQRSAPHA